MERKRINILLWDIRNFLCLFLSFLYSEYMSLYTKYRPRDWDSLVGQETINHILRNSLRLWRVGHAYIFTGSRGTGKTSSARILAKWINCKDLQDGNPCHSCNNCQAFDEWSMLDVIEIDAASNTWVDNIRDLIEKARFEPSQGSYKIYIIDEVHMLSDGAFNALLKTLEEPPSHVKFILATTEIDKVPETIQSRSLRFDFEKIRTDAIVSRLKFVTLSEWIVASDECLEIIALSAHGWMRDALTILEQQSIWWVLDEATLRANLSLLDTHFLNNLLSTLFVGDESTFFEMRELLLVKHIKIENFFDQLLKLIREKMFSPDETTNFREYDKISEIIEQAYGKIKYLPDSKLLLDITLLRILRRNVEWPVKKPTLSKDTIKIDTVIPVKSIENTLGTNWNGKEKEHVTPPQVTPTISENTTHEEIKESSFSYILLLNTLKATKPALVADLKSARFEQKDRVLSLIFEKEWNYQRVNTPIVRGIICETLENLFQGTWNVVCQLWGETNKELVDQVFT